MGWFLKSLYKDSAETIFSSPSGDGLVRVKNAAGAVVITIFVPEWGWVGSKLSIESMRATRNFRPRFGMGWFLAQEYSINWTPRFSSPSGDGLVPPIVKHSEFVAQFSSPSGVGLVPHLL